MLTLLVRHQLSYDQHHLKKDHIVRVVNEYSFAGKPNRLALTSESVGPLLQMDFPDKIDAFVRFKPLSLSNPSAFSRDATTYMWPNVYVVDQSVFSVFTHDIIYGDPETALTNVNSIAVSESFSNAYFGNENPLGLSVVFADEIYQIDLVFRDNPSTTHFKYDALVSNVGFVDHHQSEAALEQKLGNVSDYTYLLMSPSTDLGVFSDDLNGFSSRKSSRMAAGLGMAGGMQVSYWAQSLLDIHLDSSLLADLPTGSKLTTVIFGVFAIVVLAVSSINFINLDVARSLRRSKEVTMRKILGASQEQLFIQFFVGASAPLLSATLLAWITVLLYAVADDSSTFSLDYLRSGEFLSYSIIVFTFVFPITVAAVASAIPIFRSFIISFKGNLSRVSGVSANRQGFIQAILMYFQFTITIVIVSCAVFMVLQMRYISSFPIGFSKENKLLVEVRGADVIERGQTIIEEIQNIPNVINATLSEHVPGENLGLLGFNIENQHGATELQSFSYMAVGDQFSEVLGIEMAEGRGFEQLRLTDSGTPFLVNMALVEFMGWDRPVGKRITSADGITFDGRVIGVVENFNAKSLHSPIEPLVILPAQRDYIGLNQSFRHSVVQKLIVNFADGSQSEVINSISNFFQSFSQNYVLTYSLLDQMLNSMYSNDQTTVWQFALFSAISILAGISGILGLSLFVAERSAKEIAIRKVLGASEISIFWRLSRSFVVVLILAGICGSIITYFLVYRWLAGFVYSIEMELWVFLLSIFISVFIGLIVIVRQFRATISKSPIEFIKSE